MLMKKVEAQGWRHAPEIPQLPAWPSTGIDVPLDAVALPTGRA